MYKRQVGVLRNFIRFRGIVLPRYFFMAVFFTALAIVYTLLTVGVPPSTFDRLVVYIACAVGALFAWVETYRLLRLKFA